MIILFLSYVKPTLLIVLMPLLLVINFSVLILLFPILACFSMLKRVSISMFSMRLLLTVMIALLSLSILKDITSKLALSMFLLLRLASVCFLRSWTQVLVGDFNAKHTKILAVLTLILVAELLRNLLKSTLFLFLTLSHTLFTIDLILTLISSILFLPVNLSLTLFFLVKLVLMLTVTIFLLLSNLILGQKDKL